MLTALPDGNEQPPAPDPAELRAARKHVKRLHAFYQLCLVATLVFPLTVIVKAMTSPNRLWFLWVALGFAIALGFAVLDIFGRNLRLGREWQQRKVRQLLACQAR